MVNHNDSLYSRLGGEPGVTKLVDVFYENVLADDSLHNFFHRVPMAQLKHMQKEFFSIALGGPSEYSDFQLAHAHQGLDIKTSHFTTFVNILFSTLSELDLNEEERFQIISQINTYVDDIVDASESSMD
ncbi:MAG: hemoglobin [Arenicella sp.]|jgi:hemoglobin